MKTPDEIKKGLGRSCDEEGCYSCPYDYCETYNECSDARSADALAYIQQLEAANAELLTKCERLERERDAAVEAIRAEGGIFFSDARMPCRYCDAEGKYTGERCHNCHNERFFGGFNWRGVKEE